MFLILLLLVVFVFSPADGYAHFNGKGHLHKLSETKQEFANRDCRLTDSCDLRRFALTTTAYEVWFSDDPDHPTYGKGAIIEYETDSVGVLEKYAVVQFKKGCVYYSASNADRVIRTAVRDRVPSFGADVPFCFRDWVIDSQDRDPVYNSDPEYGRFHLLRWNLPGSYEQRTQKFYGLEKPKRPVVYLADYPAGAFVTGTGVRNVALTFETCIYKAADVPLNTQRTDIHFARPIHCIAWDNVYVYDFAVRSFHPTWPDYTAQARAVTGGPPAQFLALFMSLLVALIAAISLLVSIALRRQLAAR